MTMIDLGDLTQPAPSPAIPVDHRRIRRAVLAVATIAGLLLMAGSARPAPPFGLRPVWSVPMTGTDVSAFGPDAAYLLRGSELTAYDLASGAVRWTAPVPDALYNAEPTGDVVLLRTERVTVERKDPDGSTHGFEFARSTLALAAGTGAELWRAVGEPTVKDGNTALFEERDERGDVVRLRLTRLADGRSIWTQAVPRTWTWTEDTDGRPDQIITSDSAGGIKVFRYADGTLVHHGQLPRTAGQSPVDADSGLVGAGGLLALVRQQPTGVVTTTIYRLDDLTRLWRRDDSSFGIRACGPVLCVLGEAAVTGHDPTTGQELWRRPSMRWAWPAGSGRVLLEDGDSTHQLVDVATGRPVGPPAYGQRLFNGDLDSDPGRSVLLLRSTTQPSGLTSVTLLDLTTGAQTLLGAINPVYGDVGCWHERRYLACAENGVLTVMTIGRP